MLKADWSEFDLQRGIWTKSSHHTKQRQIEHVPMSVSVMKLLRSMKPQPSGALITDQMRSEFPGANGEARVTVRRPWVQVLKAAGLGAHHSPAEAW